MTNFERIKAMSVEELADFIMCPYDPTMCYEEGLECFECCKKWLESEAEG